MRRTVPRRIPVLMAFVLALLMPASALAARPGVSLTLDAYGPDTENANPTWCNIQITYQWAGFNKAAYDEVYIYYQTLQVAYGIGFDGSGGKLANPILKSQSGDSMGTGVYWGDTVELHADLLDRNGTVISKTVVSLPTFTVGSDCVPPY